MSEYSYQDQRIRAFQLLDCIPDEKLINLIGTLEILAPRRTPPTPPL